MVLQTTLGLDGITTMKKTAPKKVGRPAEARGAKEDPNAEEAFTQRFKAKDKRRFEALASKMVPHVSLNSWIYKACLAQAEKEEARG